MNQSTLAKILTVAAITLTFSACTKKTETTTSTTTTNTTASPGAANDGMTSTSGSPAAGGTTGSATGGTSATTTTTSTTESKVGIVDSVVGKGAEAVNGKAVTVHYTGTLKDGTQFDTSKGREPFTFTLGSGQVIKGWEQGIQGMKVGGKRKLTIPSELAYGANAVGSIPANSTLLFDVELLDVK